MNKVILILHFLAFTYFVQAQSNLESVIAKCPEIKVGELYDIESIRAQTTVNESGGIVLKSGDKTEPIFAKMTGKDIIVLFILNKEEKDVKLDAYIYRKKTLKMEHFRMDIYEDYKMSLTRYRSKMKLNQKGVLEVKTQVFVDGEYKRTELRVYKETKKRLKQTRLESNLYKE